MTAHNLPSLKARRKELRATMTPAEIRLWQALKQRQLNHLKFRRQHSMGPFIVDFYCPSANLVVELDGSSHDSEEAWRHDERRTAYLESLGLKVTRFENQDVMNNLEGVLAEIARITTPALRATPPCKGGEMIKDNHPATPPCKGGEMVKLIECLK